MRAGEQRRLTLDLVDTEADLCALVSIAPATDDTAEALALVLGPADAATVVAEPSATLERTPGSGLLRAAGLELEDRGEDGIAARVAVDGMQLDVEAQPRAPSAQFDRDQDAAALAGAARQVTPARVTGLVDAGRGSHSVDATGHRVRTAGAVGWDRLSGLGALHASLAHGGLLCAWAARPRTAEGHGDEAVSAVMQGPDGTPEPVLSALLSTQYDANSRQQRATLELEVEHPGEEEDDADAGEDQVRVRVIRGAGTLLRGATIELPGRRAEVGFFRWSIDGDTGLGRYDRVWRR